MTAPWVAPGTLLFSTARATNPRYHRLIESFRDLTGVLMTITRADYASVEPPIAQKRTAFHFTGVTTSGVALLELTSRQPA